MKFNDRLIDLRRKRGLSQEALGNEINVTRQTVSKWELGETTPEMDKLLSLAKLFDVSVDYLTGLEEEKAIEEITAKRHNCFGYEFKSKKTIKGVPLVHINIGFGLRIAKGIIAIGNISKGIIAIGGISLGIFSLGGLSLGLLAIGGLVLGLLAIGGISAGIMAIGGIAIGLFSIGGLAIGKYAIGGAAIASDIALGGYASGHIAIGDKCKGTIEYLTKNGEETFDKKELYQTIKNEYPSIWNWIADLFASLPRHK